MKFNKTKKIKRTFDLPEKTRQIQFVIMNSPFEGYEISTEGHIRQIKHGFILQPTKCHNKLCVQLYGSDNSYKRVYVDDINKLVKFYFNAGQ